MSRREIREHIIKLLYCTGFYQDEEEITQQIELYVDRISGSQPQDNEEITYMRNKLGKILESLDSIDEVISNTATSWKPKRRRSSPSPLFRS